MDNHPLLDEKMHILNYIGFYTHQAEWHLERVRSNRHYLPSQRGLRKESEELMRKQEDIYSNYINAYWEYIMEEYKEKQPHPYLLRVFSKDDKYDSMVTFLNELGWDVFHVLKFSPKEYKIPDFMIDFLKSKLTQ